MVEFLEALAELEETGGVDDGELLEGGGRGGGEGGGGLGVLSVEEAGAGDDVEDGLVEEGRSRAEGQGGEGRVE